MNVPRRGGGTAARPVLAPAVALSLRVPARTLFLRVPALALLLLVSACSSDRLTEDGSASDRPSNRPSAGTTDGAPVCAQIFSTNDTHGHLLPAVQSWSSGRLVGGSAALAAYANQARRDEPSCPLFIASGGDLMQGTLISNLTDGASTIDAMNAIGYDAAAIGNHEFDWGVDILKARIDQAEFALLGANIFLKGTDQHPDWVRPWTIVERDGVRVGFVGMTTRSTPTAARPANVAAFEFRSIADALDRYIPEVRRQGVDFVVAVMHEGGFCEQGGSCSGEALRELGAATARFDYAVTGHTHARLETSVNGVPVVQSNSNATAFGLGRLDRDADGMVSATLVGVRNAYVDEIEPDSQVARVVERYRATLDVDRVVTQFSERLRKPRRGDFPLGRLIADAQRAHLGTQVALMNNGGIRRPMPAGDITYADLFELQPFGNALVKLTLLGRDLLDALEHAARDDGTDLQVSGLTVRIDPGAPRGSRILGATLDDGSSVEPDRQYTVTVNDFIAGGGSGYTMFFEAISAEPTGIPDLDALVAYLEGLPQPVVAPSESRWIRSARP